MRNRLSLIAVLLLARGNGLAQGTAQLAVVVGGLPSGLSAQVTISGPAGYHQTLSRTSTLAGITPGSYSVAAGSITSATGVVYLPVTFPSATVQVVAGQTAAITVEYETLAGAWESIGPTAIQGGRAGWPARARSGHSP